MARALKTPHARRQRITLNVSHGRPGKGVSQLDPAVQRLLNSNYKRAVAITQRDPNVSLISQGPSQFYDFDQDDFSQIVATRLPTMNQAQMDRARAASTMISDDPAAQEAEYQRRLAAHEARVTGGFLPHRPDTPNRTLIPDEIFKDMVRKYDAGRRNLVIDEIAAGTAPEVTQALQRAAAERPELLKGLSVYMTAGPNSGPKAFSPDLLNLLRNHKIRTYAELYGGKTGGKKVTRNGKTVVVPNEWSDRDWAQSFNAMRAFRDQGVDMTPMMSLSSKHIGTGPRSIGEARERAWKIYNETGFIPSVWHMTAAKAPSPTGMGAAVERWIRNMRKRAPKPATIKPTPERSTNVRTRSRVPQAAQ